MEKKYEMTDETIEFGRRTLRRIRALRDFGYVKKGDLGGFIEKESNLSHKRDCWIFGNAQVSDYAEVGGASIGDNAKVFDYARIYGNSVIGESVHVYGNAKIYNQAYICCRVDIAGNCKISGSTVIVGREK
ncbi:hypothetical protein [Bartonella sp. AP72JLCBS]|uniref:hypothetical protein n=1 Tax=Bartonella sp. AP72JLCBS TaxID=3243502 RepID=UPI0035CE9E80